MFPHSATSSGSAGVVAATADAVDGAISAETFLAHCHHGASKSCGHRRGLSGVQHGSDDSQTRFERPSEALQNGSGGFLDEASPV